MIEASLEADGIRSPDGTQGLNILFNALPSLFHRDIRSSELLWHPSLAQTGNCPPIAQAVERGEAPTKQNRRLEWSIDDACAQLDAFFARRYITQPLNSPIGYLLRI